MRSHLEKTKKDVTNAHFKKFGQREEKLLLPNALSYKNEGELPKIQSIQEMPLEAFKNVKLHEFHIPHQIQSCNNIYIRFMCLAKSSQSSPKHFNRAISLKKNFAIGELIPQARSQLSAKSKPGQIVNSDIKLQKQTPRMARRHPDLILSRSKIQTGYKSHGGQNLLLSEPKIVRSIGGKEYDDTSYVTLAVEKQKVNKMLKQGTKRRMASRGIKIDEEDPNVFESNSRKYLGDELEQPIFGELSTMMIIQQALQHGRIKFHSQKPEKEYINLTLKPRESVKSLETEDNRDKDTPKNVYKYI